ncbi:hypothetical protein Zmor_025200 [Zophobas morio]|uniref:Uncharacterized protein n=1 Tax=Zophobas morio TaxID=2755281 RepID=A0AA38HR35_9CUCU|nr:hypothetical protein Zmor_025200 [Zophobas morio]
MGCSYPTHVLEEIHGGLIAPPPPPQINLCVDVNETSPLRRRDEAVLFLTAVTSGYKTPTGRLLQILKETYKELGATFYSRLLF